MRKLHPNLEQWLITFNDTVKKLIATGFKPTPTNAREGLAHLTKQHTLTIPEMTSIQDDLVYTPEYQVPVRIYHPKPDTALPVLIYYHGGGHMAGSVTVYDPICRRLALTTQHIVVSVDYRLSPECPYPAAINDAYYVVKNIWTTLNNNNINYEKTLSIAGDSGGGALVASTASKAQFDASIHIKHQVMIYPSLDYTMSTPSITQNGEGYLLGRGKILWYFDHYFLHGENRKAASPLYQDITKNIPKTLIITAEFCPLRDENFLYIERLKANNVAVEHLHFDDMIHTFMNLESIVPDACLKVYESINNFLND